MSTGATNATAPQAATPSNLESMSDAELCAADFPVEVLGREIIRRAFRQALAEVIAEYPDLILAGVSR